MTSLSQRDKVADDTGLCGFFTCCPRKGAIVLSFLSKSINARSDRDENTAKILGKLTRLESRCGIAYDTLCEET